MKPSLIFLIVLLALVALFTVQNPGVISVRFLTFTGDTLLLVVVVAAFAAGVLGTGIAALPGYFRRRSESAAARERVRELEAEAKALKAEIDLLKRKPEPPKPEPPRAGGAA